MKSLVRWSATVGLVGSALIGSFSYDNLQALALTEDQVVQKLQSVPVFTVTDAQGHHWLPLFRRGKTKTRQQLWQASLSARRTLRLLLSG
jgi:nickel transport protein